MPEDRFSIFHIKRDATQADVERIVDSVVRDLRGA